MRLIDDVIAETEKHLFPTNSDTDEVAKRAVLQHGSGNGKGGAEGPEKGEWRLEVDRDALHLAQAEELGARSEKIYWRFRGLDEFGREYGRGLTYHEMANNFFAVVVYPYDVSLMIFYEYYSMGVPLFVPEKQYLHFFILRGLHAYATHHFVDTRNNGTNLYPVSPFFASLDAEQWYQGASYWTRYCDFYQFPHLQRFHSANELMLKLDVLDATEVSMNMRTWTDVNFGASLRAWHGVLENYADFFPKGATL